jgi:hypothetical protein
MENRGHRHFNESQDAQDDRSSHVIDRATGVIMRRDPKRDKNISARQWRKQRSAYRRAAKKGGE